MLTREFLCPGDRTPTKITTFVSTGEMVEYAKLYAEREGGPERYDYDGYSDWAGMKAKEAWDYAVNGDPQFVPTACDLLAKVDVDLPPTRGFDIVRSPHGSRFAMGDWLAESPTPMRRRVKRNTDRGMVQIFLSVSPSASIRPETMGARGAAIIALVMKIQQYRPVDVMLYEESQTPDGLSPWYSLVHVHSQPLSLAHVGFAVGHPAFFRQVAALAERWVGVNPAKWAPDQYAINYNERRNQRLSIQPEDVILSSMTDWSPLVNRPVEWIKAELQRIGIEV